MDFLLVANFKMNKTLSEIKYYIDELNDFKNNNENLELVISPSFTSLGLCSEKLNLENIKISAQNMYFEEKGAFTGEISGEMLKDLKCYYVILGHSERRKYFQESNELINKKIISAIKNGIRPILCIGESLKIKNEGKTKDFLEKQIIECTKGIDIGTIDIAYEPVWAIGSGETATPEYIKNVHSFIKTIIGDNKKTKIIYGGSVKVENSKIISKIENVNGLLIGNTTLDVKNFIKIAKIID